MENANAKPRLTNHRRPPEPKAKVRLDGMEMELIIQELKIGARRARLKADHFRASLLLELINKIKGSKIDFHQEWTDFFRDRFQEEQRAGPIQGKN